MSPCGGQHPAAGRGAAPATGGGPRGTAGPGRAAPHGKLPAPAGSWEVALGTQSCCLESWLVIKPAPTPEASEGLRGPETRSQRHQGSVPQLLPAPRHLAGLLGRAGRASPAKPACTSGARLSQQQHPESFGRLLPKEPGSEFYKSQERFNLLFLKQRIILNL